MTAPEAHPPNHVILPDFDCDVRNCTQPASFVAQVHVIDNCTSPAFRLTPDGNSIHLYCTHHLQRIAQEMGNGLKHRLGKLPNGVNFFMCQSCQRPIATLHDLLDTETL